MGLLCGGENVRLKWMRALSPALVALLWFSAQTARAQQTEEPTETGASEDAESARAQQFGGPNSVPGQLADDRRLTESLVEQRKLAGYFDWKDRLREEKGFSYTVDYTAGLFGASQTLEDEDTFSGGAVRFFGSWDLVGRKSGNTGTFIWKVEHRHKYSEIPPSGMASEIGYVGLILPVISNQGSRLTNLYWKQNLSQNRVEVILGMIDTTDWVDLYALASPWTGFTNFALATGGASIPVPDDGALGLYVNAMLSENLYAIGGFADSNSNSSRPFNGFDTFGDHEFFKTIEVGWVTSRDRFYFDNTHITYWHADERVEAGVLGGSGFAFSFAHAFDDKWTPFVRAGLADDGGSLLQKTFSTGLGFHFEDDVSLFGLGFNWGEPNEGTFGPGLDDQYAVELFSRLQILRNLQVTPDIQWIGNPARNPEASGSWTFGVRARLLF